jgi:hypothetical protein
MARGVNKPMVTIEVVQYKQNDPRSSSEDFLLFFHNPQCGVYNVSISHSDINSERLFCIFTYKEKSIYEYNDSNRECFKGN